MGKVGKVGGTDNKSSRRKRKMKISNDDKLFKKNRPRRIESDFALSQEAEDAFNRLKLDPIAEMIMYAKGDVVGLGLMTQEELDSDEEFNAEGMMVRTSGHFRALELIPPKLRAEQASRLVEFHLARKKSKDDIISDDDSGEGVVVYVPSNGRDVSEEELNENH